MHGNIIRKPLGVMALLAAVLWLGMAQAQARVAYPGTRTMTTPYSFPVLLERLHKAVTDHGMAVVAEASASAGAAKRGVKIPGNAVVMVFRNDFAVRMLEASVPAGIEAPLRIYVTENTNGTASITYRTPTAVFAPYANAKLDALAKELDPIFAKIVHDAAGK